MKKTYLMLALAAGLLASCDMDKEPYNALPDTEGISTPTDYANARVGLYSGLRSSIDGNFYNAPEIQCDGFDAVTGFSNSLGDMYRYTFTSSTSYFETVYGNYQAIISRANYILDGWKKFETKSSYTAENLATVKTAVGDAYFTRAYGIFMLSQYFCADYELETADAANSGVSYRLDYAPSSNAGTYPARATLKETMKQVADDLDSAAVYITDAGEASYGYYSQDAITALRARMALYTHDYANAASYAKQLIDGGKYTLAQDAEELEDLWHNDGGNETILQLAVPTKDELPAQTGIRYQPYSDGAVPDYVPTQTLMDLYNETDATHDIRLDVYFNQVNITTNTGATGKVYAFNKYADHGGLYTMLQGYEYARFAVEPKVFTIAEMYLIAAEAYTQAGDLTNGAKYLNELKKARIENYTETAFPTKNALMNEVKNERERELIGQGTRLFDLKRWHEGIKRGTPQQRDLCLLPGATTTDFTLPANANKMTWPIPKHETDVNKKIVQNPGY